MWLGMRRYADTAKSRKVAGSDKAEPLAEGIQKQRKNFTQAEIDIIKRRRAELMTEGKQDMEISRILATELQRPTSSISAKIRQLVQSKELP